MVLEGDSFDVVPNYFLNFAQNGLGKIHEW
jgi:hypothetical protein